MEMFHKIIRRISRFAWREMLFDVARVEWKYGRHDDGTPKDWTEWYNVRNHLKETGHLVNYPRERPKSQGGLWHVAEKMLHL